MSKMTDCDSGARLNFKFCLYFTICSIEFIFYFPDFNLVVILP